MKIYCYIAPIFILISTVRGEAQEKENPKLEHTYEKVGRRSIPVPLSDPGSVRNTWILRTQ